MRVKERMYDLKELISFEFSNYLGDTKLHLRGYSDAGYSEDVDSRLVHTKCLCLLESCYHEPVYLTLGSFDA